MIFDIQRYSLHDGEGMRTTIFLKGCTLRCRWCCNPESQDYASELMFDSNHCILCGDCIRIAENNEISMQDQRISVNFDKVKHADKYAGVCPAKALTVIGRNQSAEELYQQILRDLPFYHRSRGGVTFSGGEPLTQPDLIIAAAEKVFSEGISLSVETCLSAPWPLIERVIPYIETFYVDFKHRDPEVFRQFTAGDLSLIDENRIKLLEAGANVIARVPVIYSFNDSEAALKALIDYIVSLKKISRVDILPYHSLCVPKYIHLGRTYQFPDRQMSPEEVFPLRDYALDQGLDVTIGG